MNRLVQYPSYPQEIPRDFDYTVRVSQNGKQITIPVYNMVTQTCHFGAVAEGDMKRRFCEFSFEGDPVTVEVEVHSDFDYCAVLPSSAMIPFSVEKNVIRYTIDRPMNTMVKINKDRTSFLAIFAEAPERAEEIPDRNDPNVVWFDAGFSTTETGDLELKSGQWVYLAPGAAVKARVRIHNAENVKITGRGSFVEPSPTRGPVHKAYYMCDVENAKNVLVRGVKFLDAHTFNLVICNVVGCEFDDVKVLSNQISTDGFSIWARGEDVWAHHCFWHVSDNVYVIGSADIRNVVFEDSLVGSDYVTFFPQGHLKGDSLIFRNIDVFQTRLLFEQNYNPDHDDRAVDQVIFEDIRAVDVDRTAPLFHLVLHGATPKNYWLKNVSAPPLGDFYAFNVGADIRDTTIRVENVWVGDQPLTGLDGLKNELNGQAEITFAPETNPNPIFVGKKNAVTTPKYTAGKVFVGGLFVATEIEPFEKDGTVWCAPVQVLKALDFEDVRTDGKILTFHDSTRSFRCELTDGVVPADFFTEELGLKTVWDPVTRRLTVENRAIRGNLFKNPDMENGLTTDWITRDFSRLTLSDDGHESGHSLEVFNKSTDNGAYQNAIYLLRRYGQGTYRMSAWVKKFPDCDCDTIAIGMSGEYGTGEHYARLPLTEDWTQISYTFELNTDPEKIGKQFAFVGFAEGGNIAHYLIDDLELVKVN